MKQTKYYIFFNNGEVLILHQFTIKDAIIEAQYETISSAKDRRILSIVDEHNNVFENININITYDD